MKLKIYQIDAFAEKPFEGNPAAVVPLKEWLPDTMMQAIAEENNLAETAFFIPTKKGFHIRWFTPTQEVELCGHATLATAHVLFDILSYGQNIVEFESLSGILSVKKKEQLLTLDFPSQAPYNCDISDDLVKGLGAMPIKCLKNQDFIAVFEKEEDIINIKPNNNFLSKLDLRGIIATAPSLKYDFVVRFFAPKYGILEDPVTGSAFTQLVPYWAERLNKNIFKAKQVSSRGGLVSCKLKGKRVLISGSAIKYMEGIIEIKT